MLKINSSIYRHIAPFLVLAIALIFSSCTICPNGNDHVDNTQYEASEQFSYEYIVDDQTNFSIDGINGNITIIGKSDINYIHISGERKVESETIDDAEECLEDLQVQINNNDYEFSVLTRQPSNTYGRNYIVNYYITVPRNFRLNIYNVNGNIETDSINNNIHLTQTNGNIYFHEIYGSIESYLTNGNIISKMALPLNGVCKLATVNGNVVLSIPDTTSAQIAANITNGNITITGLTLTSQQTSPHEVTGILNDGNGTIDIDVVNGSIQVMEK